MVTDERLFQAADALLEAVSREGDQASMVMLIDEPSAGDDLPEGVYTATELTEALNMLMRLGLVTDRILGIADEDPVD